MNLQRRDEIRAIATEFRRLFLHEQAQAIDELLAHIDALEQAAAERVIDSGRLEAAEALAERLGGMVERMKQGIKPSTAERCAARWAMSSAVDRGSFERGWDAREAEGSRSPTPDYTGEGSAWVPPAEAQAVVVPELTEEDLVRAGRPYCINDREPFERGARWAAAFIRERARAIPADRVLGEGMVAVKWISVNDALPENGQTVGFVTECANDKWYHGRVLGGRYMAGELGGFSVPGLMVQASHWFAFPPLPDSLRANQGGAAT